MLIGQGMDHHLDAIYQTINTTQDSGDESTLNLYSAPDTTISES